MSKVLYPSPIFGPIRSRRLGISLGINLMPADGKICTFDCIYCECGYNADSKPTGTKRPSREEVKLSLYAKLLEMRNEGELPDSITFAGNGEPTTHMDFAGIVDDVIELRNAFCPKAKISVLNNGTMLMREGVVDALLKVDNNVVKLDTVNKDYVTEVDRPVLWYNIDQQIKLLQNFQGHVIIQTIFMKGESPDGKSFSNLNNKFINPWIRALKKIGPQSVMVYTIDRDTPNPYLQKASPAELDDIVSRLRSEGFEASASY